MRRFDGHLGRLAVLGAAIPVVLACAWPILSWPLAPLPPVSNVRYGTREILGRELGVTWCVGVPRRAVYHLVFRARSLSAAPAFASVELRDETARIVASGRFEGPPGPDIVDAPFLGPPILLEPDHSYRLTVTGAEPGLALDALSLRSDGLSPITVEAEGGDLTPETLVGVDSAASSGRWLGVLPRERAGVERVTQTFRAEADGLYEVILNLAALPTSVERVRLVVTDVVARRRVFEERARAGSLSASSLHRLRFPAIPESRGRTYEIAVEQSAAHPVGVPLGPRDLYRDGELRFNGWQLASELEFIPRYASRWNVLSAVAIPLIAILLGVGLRSRAAGRAVLTGVISLVGLLSVAAWQREYQYKSPGEFMPDGYGAYAERIRGVLDGTAQGGLARFHADLKVYPHAHNPLAPCAVALVALVALVDGDVVRSYLLVTFLFSVGTGWILLLLLEQVPGATWAATWAVWGGAVTHFLFIRAAARTSTDPVGYFFVVLSFFLAARILRTGATPASLSTLIGALALGLFARLTVLPMIPILALVALAPSSAEPDTPPGRGWARRAPGALAVALVPPGLFFGSMALAGLLPTFTLLGRKMALFSDARTPGRFLICSALLLGLFAVPALCPPGERRQAPFRVLGIVTVVVYLVFLGATSTFWNRHFLHALPGVLLAAAPGVDSWQRTRPDRVRLWLWASVALGLGWTAFNLVRGVGVGAPYLID